MAKTNEGVSLTKSKLEPRGAIQLNFQSLSRAEFAALREFTFGAVMAKTNEGVPKFTLMREKEQECSFRHLAETVVFEPTCRLLDKRISSASRYDLFGTSPSE